MSNSKPFRCTLFGHDYQARDRYDKSEPAVEITCSRGNCGYYDFLFGTSTEGLRA